MSNPSEVIKLSTRFGLMALIFLLVSSGCMSTPSATPVRSITPTTVASQAPLGATQLPSGTIPAYSSGTATILPPKAPALDVVPEMLNEVDRDRVITNLKRLTGEEPICNDHGCHTISNRLTGSKEVGYAKDYVSRELSGLGYSVEIFDWSRSGYADQDIVVRKAGASHPSEEVYFVAHLDGVMRLRGIPFPAADDNASGVVDLLELAGVLSNHSFDRTVVLMFSTGEEQGDLGVASYIEQLSPQELDAIKYVVDVDMIGYDGDDDGVMQLWSGDDAPSLALAQGLSEIVKAYQPALVPTVVTGCT